MRPLHVVRLATLTVLIVGVTVFPGSSGAVVADRATVGHHGTHHSDTRHHPTPPRVVVLRGDLARPQLLSTRKLASLAQQTVVASYTAGGVPTTKTFTGPLLLDVVNLGAPRIDPTVSNDSLSFAIRATATDRYDAVVSWGEIDPGFEGKQVLLALTEDGVALERPRLVVPGDAKGGRYVSDVVDLKVQDLSGW